MSEPQFFETITKSFEDVKIDESGVDTADFAEAAENLVKIFGLFGNPAFVVVQNDMTGNIAVSRLRGFQSQPGFEPGVTMEAALRAPLQTLADGQKIRSALAANPTECSTLEKMLEYEKNNLKPKERKGTEGLLWLLRGLKFTMLGLRENLSNPTEELSASFTKGYENSLKKHHGFAVRPVFYLAMKACPYRATFYPKLGQPTEAVMPKLESWLSALEAIVKKEEGVFKAGGFGEI